LGAGIRAEARVPVGLWRGEEMLRLAKRVGADLVVTGAHRVGGEQASRMPSRPYGKALARRAIIEDGSVRTAT
jgi:nucleotide-binding universal stress UspA family protein